MFPRTVVDRQEEEAICWLPIRVAASLLGTKYILLNLALLEKQQEDLK